MNGPEPHSRTALTDLGDIRSWAESHGAVPIRSETTAGTPIGFEFADDPAERISWDRFHTSFEQAGLALLVDETDFAFVGRSQVSDPQAEGASGGERRGGHRPSERPTRDDR